MDQTDKHYQKPMNPPHERYLKMVETLEYCEQWFQRYSPTAPCIDGAERIHPMLEMIQNTIKEARRDRTWINGK